MNIILVSYFPDIFLNCKEIDNKVENYSVACDNERASKISPNIVVLQRNELLN